MNRFDILTAVNGIVLLLAIWRLRPATLIIAGNQLITLRALSNISRFGEPMSQSFVPASVFSQDNLAIAANLFSITSLYLVAFVLLNRRQDTPPVLPKLPNWVTGLLAIYFLVIIFSQRTILTHAYNDPGRTVYGFNLSGGGALLSSAFLYEIVRRVRVGQLKRWTGFALLTLLFIATDYLKGQTGLATGFVVTAAVLIFAGNPRRWRRAATLAAILSGIATLALAVRTLRQTVHLDGGSAVITGLSNLQAQNNEVERNAEGMESQGNGSQYAAHVLEGITLYEANLSREWKSVYLPLVYTFQPSFLLPVLGIERPKEAAWELGEYYIGGGGFFVIGELYWNGGYLCVALVFLGLVWLAWRCDVGYAGSVIWLIMTCSFSTSLLQGMGYGFAQASRGAINGLLMLLIWRVARRFSNQPVLQKQ